MTWRVDVGDCVALMAAMPACSVDAVVCDPPYELGFMSKAWDSTGIAYQKSTWAEALRVLKPGGHLLAFGGTRTSHRLACAIEDAGFEIRDTICWLYGSGFPKSLDVGKAIDKQAGAEREVVGVRNDNGRKVPKHQNTHGAWDGLVDVPITEPATPDAQQWDGWGTALKPAHEPIVLARKPLAGTVAANVLEHGTGGLNVDGCRVGTETRPLIEHTGGDATKRGSTYEGGDGIFGSRAAGSTSLGRWPANVVLDEQAAVLLDQQSGELKSGSGPLRRNADKFRNTYGTFKGTDEILPPGDSGGASRFFYTAKASRAERNAGLDGFEEREQAAAYGDIGPMDGNPRKVDTGHIQRVRNHHPTVKPVALMRWLCRLVTPPDGLILDPFAGSGTTGIAAVLEGFNFLGCEQDEAYADIARARVGWWEQHGHDALRIVAEQEAAENEREAVRQSGQMELL